MPTSAIAGFRCQLRVSAAGVTYTKAGELKDCTLTLTSNSINANHHDEPVYESKVPGRIGASITGTMNFVATDAGQAIIQNAQATPGSYIYIKLHEADVEGKWKATARAVVTNFTVAFPDAEVATRQFSADIDGAVTFGTVAAGDLI